MKPLIVVDSVKRWDLNIAGAEVVSSYDYLSTPAYSGGAGRKVFNLCRSFKYQAAGYYVSLLAEARGHRPLPSVTTMQDLKLPPVVKLAGDDIDALVQKNLRRIKGEAFELSVYFGHNLASGHDALARAIFNAFPAPLLRARFERDTAWRLVAVRAIGLADVPESHRAFLVEQAGRYVKRAPRRNKEAPPTRFDLAILHDPADPLPPSDAAALKKFIAAGEALGIGCELITKDAYGRIAEYDGLFIRDTTGVNHYTYRIARRAEALGMVVVDDPTSILRCCNKVYLAETLARHKLPTPRTLILTRDNAAAGLKSLGFPCVVKQPDSAFSAGVHRVDSAAAMPAVLDAQFAQTELLIAQEYLPTDFDWRVGVLGGKALFACRYGMAAGHWQIMKHEDGGGVAEGDSETVAVADAPPYVIDLALKAAALMGSGLYGVDLKEVDGRAIVIEVNDNPNLDAGIEDAVLGDALYEQVMSYFFWKMEIR